MMKIMPLEQLKYMKISEQEALESIVSDHHTELEEIIHHEYIFTSSGKEAIRLLLNQFAFTREDEIFITTSTDTSYVSTCVSATIFNFSKISRVISDKTKMIYVIHNFAFPHPDLYKLREIADKRNIILIEDCAFAFDSLMADGTTLGSVGDYAIYSLPKIIPIEQGGILSFKEGKEMKQHSIDIDIKKSLQQWIPKLHELKNRKQRNYKYLFENIKAKEIYGPLKNENPFMFGFSHQEYLQISSVLAQKIELGRTHVSEEIHIPVNPFIDIEDYHKIIKGISSL